MSNTAMQSSLTMNFANARIEPSVMWSTVWVRMESGTVIGYDDEDYTEPMTRVLFSDGRIGTYKRSEMGRRA